MDASDNGRLCVLVFNSKGRDSNRSFTMLNRDVIDASNDSCSSKVAFICSSTCFALKTCDADIGLMGGGACEWLELGLLSDTLSRISSDGMFWDI